MAKAESPDCRAFQAAIDVLGRPWTGLILNVLQEGPLRFGQICERTPGLGDKILSARLKDLEARGLVSREVDAGPPVRVTYAVTEKGRAFGEVAEAIERWGQVLTSSEKPRRRKSG
jgi:DNA-binding HxlR family transcriptional regulator